MENLPIEFSSRGAIALDFAKLTSMIVKDLNLNKSSIYKKFKKEDVERFLGDPIRYSKDLQKMSEFLYNASSLYRKLINFYATMPKLDHYVEPFGIDTSQKINEKKLLRDYQKAIDEVERRNIKHEFGKALITAWKVGTFYGYEVEEGKDSYFIMQLPYEFCKISGIYDGVMTFSFDMTYFDRRLEELEHYPKEFKKMYNAYKNKGVKWQAVPPEKSICIKVGEDTYDDIPPFIAVFEDIFDIADYKKMKKVSDKLDNYKFLVEKIPIRENSDKNNDFKIDMKTTTMFHNRIAGTLPEEIGAFTSPFDIEVIEFKKDKSGKDNAVKEAERSFYTTAGVNQDLFNPEKTSHAGLRSGIKVYEAEVFLLLRQIERIVTTKMKSVVSGSFKFKVIILDNTIFNTKENTDLLIKGSTFGLPLKTRLCASLGLEPSAITNMTFLENDVLNLNERFMPLQSSHTMTNQKDKDKKKGVGDGSGIGSTKVRVKETNRALKDDDELSEKGAEQRARGDNEARYD